MTGVLRNTDFSIMSVHAAFFFHAVQLSTVDILTDFWGPHKETFDGIPLVVPDADKPPAFLPLDAPLITLKNKGTLKHELRISRVKADMFRYLSSLDESIDAKSLHNECLPVLEDLAKLLDLRVWRLGSVCTRYREIAAGRPAKALAKWYCMAKWTGDEGPLRNPNTFEMSVHKVYHLKDFKVNSWIRHKTGQLYGVKSGEAIIIEQDINTPAEDKGAQFDAPEREEFFASVADEMETILKAYYP